MGKSNNFFNTAKWLVCLIALLIFVACSAEEAPKEAAQEQETVKAAVPEKPKQKTYNSLGEILITKHFKYIGTNYKISKTATDANGNVVESKDGKFLVIDMEATNMSNETQYLAADTFNVTDSRGRSFDPLPAFYGDVLNSDYGSGVARKGMLAFEVSIGSKGMNVGVNSRELVGLVEKKERILYVKVGEFDGTQGSGL